MAHRTALLTTSEDLAELAAALEAERLPAEDVGEPGRLFLRFLDAEGRTVGFGGLEVHGSAALLRSLVTLPHARGRGHARAMVDGLMCLAAENGAGTVYLLTTTAAPFFRGLGFEDAAREHAPAAIAASRQFAGLCPASAAFLAKHCG